MNKKIILIGLIAIALVFVIGCTGEKQVPQFSNSGNDVCTIEGKPVVRLYSTTWCPHCNWVKETFDSVAKEYETAGKIVAYHWEIDTGDNTLTSEVENEVPASELTIFQTFNPRGSIPLFVVGCRYYRLGNAYEDTNDLGGEEQEFRKIFDQIIVDSQQ